MSIYMRNWDATPRPVEHVQSGGSFWRKEEPELDAAGKIVKGGMWPHQRELWDMPNFVKIMVAGYGAGKSMWLGKRAIALALHNAPVPVAVISPTFPMAKLTMIPTIQNLLHGKSRLLGKQFWWRFVNQPPPCFRFRYRGREALIYILSAEKPLALKGSNLAAAVVDEAFIQQQSAFESIVARVRHPDATHLEICLGGTPEDLNWGYDLCEGELSTKYDVGVIHAPTSANKALPPGYYERLAQGYSALAVNAYLKGEFTNMSRGRVYYGFDPKEHVIDRKIPPGAILGVGMDFNVNPMAAAVFWRLDRHIHYFDEIELPNADTDYMAHHLRSSWSEDQLLECYPDATGANRKTVGAGGISDHTILKSHGFKIISNLTNPAVKDRENAVNGKFRPGDGSAPTISISPTCKKLIKYLSTYAHEKINTAEHKAMSHLLDAFGYPIAKIWPISKIEHRRHRLGE